MAARSGHLQRVYVPFLSCALTPSHPAVKCKHGRDIVICNKHLRNVVANLSCHAHLVNVPWSLKMSGVGVDLCSLTVETFENWGKEAQGVFTRLASHLAITLSLPKTSVLDDISGRLNVTLVRCIARAILAWKGRSCLPDCVYCTSVC